VRFQTIGQIEIQNLLMNISYKSVPEEEDFQVSVKSKTRCGKQAGFDSQGWNSNDGNEVSDLHPIMGSWLKDQF
jgi:hypothetical protein